MSIGILITEFVKVVPLNLLTNHLSFIYLLSNNGAPNIYFSSLRDHRLRFNWLGKFSI